MSVSPILSSSNPYFCRLIGRRRYTLASARPPRAVGSNEWYKGTHEQPAKRRKAFKFAPCDACQTVHESLCVLGIVRRTYAFPVLPTALDRLTKTDP